MRRLAFWILRNERLRLDITCPHGTFVPIYVRHQPRMAPATCDRCGFRVKVTALSATDPGRQR